MAVPFAGALSLRGIAREKRYNNYSTSTDPGNNLSLTNMSTGTQFGLINTANSIANRPDTSTPHAMSEWYNYDHDKTSLTIPTVGIGTVSVSGGILSMIGNVSATGGATVTARGHVASSNTTAPTLSNNQFTETHPTGGTGQYTTSRSTNQILTAPSGTTYYIRAYATNSQGTAYGSSRSILITSQGQI